MTINKSVTILAIPGAVGSIVGNGGDAISVNGAGVKVTLRNLVFVNLSGGSNNGVSFTQGSTLTIRDSSFTGLPNAAVYINFIGMKAEIINSFFGRNGAAVRVFGGVVKLLGNHILNNIVAVEAAAPARRAGLPRPPARRTGPRVST